MVENFNRCRVQGPGMSMLEDDSTIYGGEVLNTLDAESLQIKATIFDNYDFTPNPRPPLAVDTKKEEILELLTKENAIIVKGFTGCGKTTQVTFYSILFSFLTYFLSNFLFNFVQFSSELFSFIHLESIYLISTQIYSISTHFIQFLLNFHSFQPVLFNFE